MAVATIAGFVELAKHATGTGSPVAWTYIALGVGNSQGAGDTTLDSETDAADGLQRVAVTPTVVTTTETNDTAQWYKVFTSTATKTITEVGIFNHASAGSGDMLLVGDLSPAAAMVSTDTLTLTIKCQFKAAS
tara:strand:- start:82 stop:480 length:399 start_codon:yes stop_codon:yes gene_type:complete